MNLLTPAYRETPAGIMAVLNLFQHHTIHYLLFKCEHIFEGHNKNLDILFETDTDYQKASTLLEKEGFVLRFEEQFEKYKKMYCHYENGIMTSIHLHREIAWHGMKIVEKEDVFGRKQIAAPGIIVPGIEDAILIHAGHVLFENFRITEREHQHFQSWDKNIDKAYILRQVQQHHWQRGFEKIISQRDSIEILAPWNVYPSWVQKLLWEPATAGYVSWKIIKKIFRRFDFRKKGCLISLLGVNGSGKTTTSKELLREYTPITGHLGITPHYYYFGWEPTFFMTKVISKALKKINLRLFQQQVLAEATPNTPPSKNSEQQSRKVKILQELSFLYQFFEFLYRYFTAVRPKLQRGEVVVSDRYFYDLFGQYPYAKQSRLFSMLIKLFPRPDFTILLNCDLKYLTTRDKFSRDKNELLPRKLLPTEYLQQQRDHYALIKNYVSLQEMDSHDGLKNITQKIIDSSWKAVVRGS